MIVLGCSKARKILKSSLLIVSIASTSTIFSVSHGVWTHRERLETVENVTAL